VSADDANGDALVVEGVTVRFGGLYALVDVSLRVPSAGIVGLIGPNGAGKTTMFDAITGVTRPSRGRLRLLGHDVTDWPVHRRARIGVARTFQRLELFGSLTVLENLVAAIESHWDRGGVLTDLFALPPTVESRYNARVQAAAMLEQLGIDTYADALAGDVPLGVARLVELGRALCTEPRLLLLDEASSGLRAPDTARLAELLRDTRDTAGTSLLVVEHDMPFVLGLCDYVYVLDFGRLLAEGTPSEVRADPAVQAAYLGDEVDDVAPARG
jgi:ABC-type branched-subunit amino acid transport system ATPase component